MTHFFFTLIREPDDKGRRMSLNLFFDTHIITQVTLNVKHTLFDKISAFGGTLGLFCGLSVISILEILYYLLVFLKRIMAGKVDPAQMLSQNVISKNTNLINSKTNLIDSNSNITNDPYTV